MTSATIDHRNAPSAAVDRSSEPVEIVGPRSLGHYLGMTVPTGIILLFAIVTAGIHTQTADWLQAIEFGVYASVWIGGGFGFMVGGVMWGLDQVEHDHA